MKSWNILSHSARLVWRNKAEALKISGALYLLALVAQLALNGFGTGPGMTGMGGVSDMTRSEGMAPQAGAGMFLAAVIQIVLSLWIAVSWHRFVLLEEYPKGWIPSFHGENMLGYLGRSLLLGIIVVTAALIVSVPLGLLGAILPPLAFIAPIAGVFAGIAVAFRLAPTLPGTAIGHPIGIRDAFDRTKGSGWTAIGLAFMTVIFLIVLQLPAMIFLAIFPPLGALVLAVVGWFFTMVSVSTLTTIYGHYIEGRDLG